MKTSPRLNPIAFHHSFFILNPFRDGFDLLENGTDALRFLFHRVTYKVERRRVPQIQCKAQLLTNIRRCMFQRAQGR